ncbi:hypothetical protein KA478_00860 [Patescibacteria group bacterium]|nr:hypothetical protein [Patescibacteria group bacterium]
MSQTDIEKMLSKTETIYAADAAMSLVIKDQSIHDLFMLLAERKGVSEIIIAEDKTTSEKLVLSKRDEVL